MSLWAAYYISWGLHWTTPKAKRTRAVIGNRKKKNCGVCANIRSSCSGWFYWSYSHHSTFFINPKCQDRANSSGIVEVLASRRGVPRRSLQKPLQCPKRKANRYGLALFYVVRKVGLVRRRGLEPLCLAALAPQASASANFATSRNFPCVGDAGGAVSNPDG